MFDELFVDCQFDYPDQGCTTFSLLPTAMRLFLRITAASEFKIFYILHCFCFAFTH